jgi:hypothetical protein
MAASRHERAVSETRQKSGALGLDARRAIMCAKYLGRDGVSCKPAEGELCEIASRVRFDYTKPHLLHS